MARVATPMTDWHSITQGQLQSVLTVLALLKDEGSGPKELHDARIACRRAEAALRLCRDLLPAKPVLWLRKSIRKVRRATNETRDLDVLHKWIKQQKGSASAGICRALKQQREDARARMVKSLGNLPQLHEHVSHLARTRPDESPMDGLSCLVRRLLDDVHRFLRCIPGNNTDAEGLHEFRIAGKRLRYACEFVTEVYPEANFRPLLQRLKQLQVRLGQIHDATIRVGQLKQLRKSERTDWFRESRLAEQQLTVEWAAWWRSIPGENAIGSAVTQIVKLLRGSR